MSKSLKERVRSQVNHIKQQEREKLQERQREEEEVAISKIEEYMRERRFQLEEIDDFQDFNKEGINATAMLRLGFGMSHLSNNITIPEYQGGKFTKAQLLQRKYRALLKKARKAREKDLCKTCKVIEEKLKNGEFRISTIGYYHEVICVELESRDAGTYKYDATVIEKFLKKRRLRLFKIENGNVLIELP